MPRISAIITTRNRPAFLAESLGSVVGQDYGDCEILVIDDASDNPEENAKVLARFSRPVRHIVRDHRGGPSAARNTGILASSSEFVAFLDDDDLWFPSKLRRQIEVFDSNPRQLPKLGVVYCGHQWIDFQNGVFRPRRMPHLHQIDDLFREQYNIVQTLLVRRACIEEAGGFHEGMAFNENLEFLARMSQHCQFDWVEDILVICRTHWGKRTGDDLLRVISGYEKCLETARALQVTPAVLHGDYYRLARLQIAAGDVAAARRSFVEAIKLAPVLSKVRYSAFLPISYALRLVGRNPRSVRGQQPTSSSGRPS